MHVKKTSENGINALSITSVIFHEVLSNSFCKQKLQRPSFRWAHFLVSCQKACHQAQRPVDDTHMRGIVTPPRVVVSGPASLPAILYPASVLTQIFSHLMCFNTTVIVDARRQQARQLRTSTKATWSEEHKCRYRPLIKRLEWVMPFVHVCAVKINPRSPYITKAKATLYSSAIVRVKIF